MNALKSALILMALVLGAAGARATPLSPGGAVTPEALALADPSSLQILGSVTGSFDFGTGLGHVTGSYEQGVVIDPFGLTCAGCLDFYFAVSEDGGLTAGIFAVAAQAFAGFTTNVGYLDFDLDEGDRTPVLASRGPGGAQVGFLFFNPDDLSDVSHVIGPGQSSAAIVIATNATAFDQKGRLVINGGRGDETSQLTISSGIFRPVATAPEPAPMPEPAPWGLLAAGLLAMRVAGSEKRPPRIKGECEQ